MSKQKSKHTPGPWEPMNHNGYALNVVSPGSQIAICTVHQKCFSKVEREANTRLIAAAPELLACCKEFVAKVDRGEARSVRSYAAMKAAIAKAEGN